MSLGITRVCNTVLKINFENGANFYSTVPKIKNKNDQLLISCKRKQLDHYSSTYYSKLEEVPLASKGWNHSKAKNDFFTVHPFVDKIPEETYSFQECGLNKDIISVLNKQDIKKATEFQYRAITTIESGRHVLLAAETGCGKTISYLLPIIKKLIGNEASNLNTPKAVVIVPNRELAYQVGEVAQILAASAGLSVKIVVGGRTKKIMMNPEFEKIDLLVATPGALGKLSSVGIYKLNECTVLDEADTLIDDSFIERMNSLLKRVSQSQIILVSATLPRQLPDVLIPIESTLKHVVSPKIHKPLLNITQKFLRLTRSSKPPHLLQIAKSNNSPMLIFTNKNETCNWVALFLRENGVTCANINGDMNYHIRVEQWNQFVRGDAQILSATDIGSRGLNTVQVRHVLNYDFPLYAADYIHRIGRVGRLGSPASCKATNFISGAEEIKLVQQIELAIRRNQPLANVDGNITSIVQKNIARKLRETA
ncbi:probable ATP-dependent RNA helicase DDX28 isoform X2 [Anoplophora glabripennis]|uniref:probable ATP-dependent RNA helicase DDX28 isoform X2 n=1 Tax=Anoplophora glabripennis TaxID=217634 RepID=UPI0008740DA7|nr:probable ATP-dependent RNA helicase DDX28 isoform X2 [Anoplophora glabripennis]